MRNLIFALLMVLCAALLLAACDTPQKVARREVDRLTQITKAAEGGAARDARVVLIDVAVAEGHRRGRELKAAGCLPATATQPSSKLVDPCKKIVAGSEVRFDAAAAQVAAAQKKVEAAADMVYAALVLVVDLLRAIDAGTRAAGWEAKLAAVVAKGAAAYADVLAAIATFKASIAALAPAPAAGGGGK